MTSRITFEDVVCPFCGCLCDDLKITVEDGIVVSNENGCAISKSKFSHHSSDRLTTSIRVSDGTYTPVDTPDAIRKAVDLLKSARRPLVYGLSSVENDAHREAYKIAELIAGVVDNTSSVCHGPTILGSQESGEAVGSLAEVKNRADLVIYWGANPLFAHPRHLSRFVRPEGEFVDSREVWVIDIRKSVTANTADKHYQVTPGHDLEVMSCLRALVRGHKLDIDEVGGLSISELEWMAERMRSTKYGVLFFGLGLTQSKGRHRNIDAAIRLVQDLNYFTKWNMMPMRGHYNVTGANKTLTWTTGYPYSVDFSRGYPRYQPGEYSAVDMLCRKEADVLLNIGADPVAHFPRDAIRHLSTIPVINLDPKENMTSLLADVNIATAMAGIECDGVAARMDGLPLYLKQVTEPKDGVLPDRYVLARIYQLLSREVSR